MTTPRMASTRSKALPADSAMARPTVAIEGQRDEGKGVDRDQRPTRQHVAGTEAAVLTEDVGGVEDHAAGKGVLNGAAGQADPGHGGHGNADLAGQEEPSLQGGVGQVGRRFRPERATASHHHRMWER